MSQYNCQNCSFTTARKSALTRHMKSHSSESDKQHQCDQCEYSATRADVLKLHKRKHSAENLFSCENCDYTSRQMSNLKRHKKIHFDTPVTLECHECEFSTSSKSKLDSHRSKEHGAILGNYSCSFCAYKSTRAHDLKSHIARKHTESRAYVCEVCGYRSVTAARLKEHKRTHTGEKPVKCSKCDFSCASQAHLWTHNSTIHEGKTSARNKLERCDICENSFRKDNFKHHMMTHTGHRPYKCELCDFTAIRKFKLVKHRKTHQIDSELREYSGLASGVELTEYGGLASGVGLDLVKSMFN